MTIGKEIMDYLGSVELLQDVSPEISNNDFCIAVLPNSWVFVGVITLLADGYVQIDCCFNIHRWGTNKGLGQLAIEGPLQDTVLYKSGQVVGKPLFLMKTNVEAWISK